MTSGRTEAREKADGILLALADLEKQVNALMRNTLQEIEAIKARHKEKVSGLEKTIKTQEKALKKLAKSQRNALFGGRDRVDLSHGALMFATIDRVKKAKGMLKRLKAAGYGEPVIKVAESVNWDELEKWTDEDLKAVGTERIEKEEFNYELF